MDKLEVGWMLKSTTNVHSLNLDITIKLLLTEIVVAK